MRGVPSRRYRRQLPPSTAGDVYFVQAKVLRLVKIGFASDAGDRLRTLQVGSPDELHLIGFIYSNNAKALEAELHTRFSDHRHHGEWFQPAPELLAFIELEATGSSSDAAVALAMAGVA